MTSEEIRVRVRAWADELVRCERGNVAIVFGLCGLLLALLSGFAITASQVSAFGAQLQDRADELALNATVAVRDGADQKRVSEHADMALSRITGGVAGAAGATATIDSADPAQVSVTMRGTVPVMFGRLFGRETWNVTRRATAVAAPGDPICLLVLAPSQREAFSRRGSSSLDAPECVVQVNSRSSAALDSRGNGRVRTLRTLVHGPETEVRGFNPAPVFEASQVADPYAGSLPWPVVPTCVQSPLELKAEQHRLNPGVHCVDIRLGPRSHLTLEPGVHVITGGLDMSSGARLTASDGVTLVFVGPASRLNVQAGAALEIEAPDQGPWSGIAVAIKPQPNELVSTIQGGGGVALQGVMYLPTQRLYLTGGGSLAERTEQTRVFVVHRIELRGNGSVFLNGRGSLAEAPGGVRLRH